MPHAAEPPTYAPNARQIERAVREIRDFDSLVALFAAELGWGVDASRALEELTFDWGAGGVSLSEDASMRLGGGVLRRLQPFRGASQPWGVFFVEFADEKVYRTALRQVLRGLARARRGGGADRPAWRHENLLFVCTTEDYRSFTFAHLRGRDASRAVLTTFGWDGGDTHIRTLCQHNLPALAYPEDPRDTEGWLRQWRTAFDAEAVKDKFFASYHEAFSRVEREVLKSARDADAARVYTLRLFSRLMSIYFIQRKGWPSFRGDRRYLRAIFPRAPGVEIPEEAFARVLELFEQYDFTLEEATPLDVRAAVDPEMLGKVFEELATGRGARREAGRYYTSRAVVSFMCREALKKHLGGFAALVDEGRADAVSAASADELLAALDNLKVVDPACGSGAYLLGMLHELNSLTELLQARAGRANARDGYRRKLRIVERNLYGVDRDKLAVQIARFRLWLSLAVEHEDQTRAEDLPTFPKPDFNIECGDSLTAPNPEKVRGGNVEFEGFDWAVEFADVFDGGGFDVVLANPPYGATAAPGVRDLYFDRRAEGPQSKDTYGLFIARGLQLLRDGGQLCYLVSDTWRTIKTHKPLRRRLVEKTTVWHVLDLPGWVFNATVNTGILTLTKRPAAEGHKLIAGDLRGIGKGDWDTLSENLRAVAAHGADVQTTTYARYTYPQSLIPTYDNCPFFVASPGLYGLMSDPRFTKLGSAASVRQGLATADNQFYLRKRAGARGSYQILDEAELLTAEQIDNLTDEEKRDGVNPEKYGGRHFLPYDKGGESDCDEGWLPNYNVPTRYFIDWSKDSVSRLRTATVADVKRRRGAGEKITPCDEGRVASRFQNSEFYFREGITFSPTGFYAPTFRLISPTPFDKEGSGIFSASASPAALLGVLCSLLSRYLNKQFINHTVHAMQGDVSELPVSMPDAATVEALEEAVSEIVEKQKDDPRYPYHLHEQRKIDALVHKLYGLNDEHVREVELWYCRRYPRLAEAQGLMREAHDKYAEHLARCERILAKSQAS